MTELDRTATLDALDAVYETIRATVDELGEPELMLPSRCAGWAVGDVLFHQLLDARRALRTFATPSADRPDVDDITYWRAFRPGDPDSAGHARYVRISASAYPPGTLAREWRDTAAAAVRAARACPHEAVATQGHTLRTNDFVATLAVEAAIHHLDITLNLPDAPAPHPAALGLVRRVLDGLLGRPVPAGWDDREYALKGTGRMRLTDADRSALGDLADRLPLFG